MRRVLRGGAAALSAALPLFLVFAGDQGCYGGGPSGSSTHSGLDASVLIPDGGHRAQGDDAGSDGFVGKTFGDGGAPMCSLPFSTDTPSTYVNKIKNLLIGLPATDAEVASVSTGGSTALAMLVDTWMTSTVVPPEGPGGANAPTYAALYQTKMLRFFELAFQQTQVAAEDYENQLDKAKVTFDGNKSTASLMLQNHQEIFARTMVQLASQSPPVPFNQAAVTTSYMMTTAMKAYFGMTDVWQVGDDVSSHYDSYANANPHQTLTVAATGTADPANGVFVDASLVITGGCTQLAYAGQAPNLWNIVVGSYPADNNNCTGTGNGQLKASDFSDWTTVTFTQGTVAPFPFWVVSDLEAGGKYATAMTLNRPYIGYFTTPAFFANWPTNASNQMRVTTNQALIVATGKQVDGTDPTQPKVDAGAYGLQADHAVPGSPCINCHWLLDPTREIFAETFGWYYGYGLNQVSSPDGGVDWLDQPAYFMFEGVESPMATLADFGTQVANHPDFPGGWAQKLCYYFNSGPCLPGDPSYDTIVTNFANGFAWNALVKSIVTSPMTTHTVSTPSVTGNADASGNCEPVAVSRRDHLCAALDARLGFVDVCGLDPAIPTVFSTKSPLNIMPGMPSDGYGRGSTVPVLPNLPSLFYRAGTENFCDYIAQLVIDNPSPPLGATTWSSTGCTASACAPIGTGCTAPSSDGGASCTAVGDFVTLVAGLPSSDPRAPLLAGALLSHFAAAAGDTDAGLGTEANTYALQSAFVAACMAPSAISIGL